MQQKRPSTAKNKKYVSQENPLEKEMATHFSILAWEIQWTEEPDRLQSVGSQRVRQDSGNLAQHAQLTVDLKLT